MRKRSRVVFRNKFAKQVSKESSVSTEEKEELSDIRKKYSNIVNYIYNYDSNIEKILFLLYLLILKSHVVLSLQILSQ